MNSGSLTVASGGQVYVGSGYAFGQGSTVGSGSLFVDSSSINVGSNGAFLVQGGSATLHGSTITLAPGTASETTMATQVSVGPGSFVVDSGSTVHLGSNAFLISSPDGTSTSIAVHSTNLAVPSGTGVAVEHGGALALQGGSVTRDIGTFSYAQAADFYSGGAGVPNDVGSVLTIGSGSGAAGVATPPSGLGALSLSPAPGLSGTSGIQPQLNADLLLDAFQPPDSLLAGADLAGGQLG